MDYNDFMNRQDAYNGFIFYRKEVLESTEDGTFSEIFAELCSRAMANDSIAQDCVAYFFNKGIPDFLQPNYDYYMSWQILSGANGNEFALEKLEFFLNPAMEEIIADEEILTEAMRKNNINKDNAVMVISNLLCEAIVDKLKLDPKKLIDLNKEPVLYSPHKNRIYIDALNDSILDVARFLIS